MSRNDDYPPRPLDIALRREQADALRHQVNLSSVDDVARQLGMSRTSTTRALALLPIRRAMYWRVEDYLKEVTK